jgi:hypothetical protein
MGTPRSSSDEDSIIMLGPLKKFKVHPQDSADGKSIFSTKNTSFANSHIGSKYFGFNFEIVYLKIHIFLMFTIHSGKL